MNLAVVQFQATHADKSASLERLLPLAHHAAARAHVAVLPEMALTGYDFQDPEALRTLAEEPDGPTFAALAPVAAHHKSWLVAGFAERAGERLYNSALAISPAGQLAGLYRKTLLFEADTPWATPGDLGYLALETDLGRVGLGICMDLNDDAFTAWCRSANLSAVALLANWLDEDLDILPYWAWRMNGFSGLIAVANTWGSEGRFRFRGQSALLTTRHTLAAAPLRGDGVLAAPWPTT